MTSTTHQAAFTPASAATRPSIVLRTSSTLVAVGLPSSTLSLKL